MLSTTTGTHPFGAHQVTLRCEAWAINARERQRDGQWHGRSTAMMYSSNALRLQACVQVPVCSGHRDACRVVPATPPDDVLHQQAYNTVTVSPDNASSILCTLAKLVVMATCGHHDVIMATWHHRMGKLARESLAWLRHVGAVPVIHEQA